MTRVAMHSLLAATVAACGSPTVDGEQLPTPKTKDDADTALPAEVTFAEHVAPIVFENCVACHRPGQSGPFPFTNYDEVRKHADQIAEVTESGFMPPWLPSRSDYEFVGARHLTKRQVQLLATWAETGAKEGDASQTPSPPAFTDGWQLGEPDLVIDMPAGYTLPADGQDVYRNFVLSAPVQETRYVRALELRPGDPQIVHHAVIRVDTTSSSRDAEAAEEQLGFDGMIFGEARMPGGHFLGWTPGRTILPGSDEESWALRPGTDFVLQMHMRPSGKPEPISASIGLYFAKTPPTKPYLALLLSSREIDIAPGQKDFRTFDEYVLPVDTHLVSIYPHAHYLGKRLEGYATLPDGTRKWLVRISDWDFNWQDQYRYEEPVFLPKGTKVTMDFSHDNSADNPLNPFDPPQRVVFGPQSTDEMSELILEVTPKNPTELSVLDQDYRRKFVSMEITHYQRLLEKEPDNPDYLGGLALQFQQVGEHQRAAGLLERAIELRPKDPDLLAALGASFISVDRLDDAIGSYQRALAIEPQHYEAHNNLGNAYRKATKPEQAVTHYRRALENHPSPAKVHNNLGVTYKQMGKSQNAIASLQKAIELEPRNALFHSNLGNALREGGRAAEALRSYESAIQLRPGWPTPVNYAAWILATHPQDKLRQPAAALRLAQQAAAATQHRNPDTMDTLAAALAASGKFSEAQQAIARAIELAEAAKLADKLPAMRERQKLYAASKAYVGP
jgi:Flp pilus assembly protein TadD